MTPPPSPRSTRDPNEASDQGLLLLPATRYNPTAVDATVADDKRENLADNQSAKKPLPKTSDLPLRDLALKRPRTSPEMTRSKKPQFAGMFKFNDEKDEEKLESPVPLALRDHTRAKAKKNPELKPFVQGGAEHGIKVKDFAYPDQGNPPPPAPKEKKSALSIMGSMLFMRRKQAGAKPPGDLNI